MITTQVIYVKSNGGVNQVKYNIDTNNPFESIYLSHQKFIDQFQDMYQILRIKVLGEAGSLMLDAHIDQEELLSDRLAQLLSTIEIQGASGNWDYDSYNHGFYNGLELARAYIMGDEANFKRIDRGGFLSDKKKIDKSKAKIYPRFPGSDN